MFILFNILIGIFISNGIPHFISGILGQHFITPFSKKKNLSRPFTNMVWGVFNFLVAYLILRKISTFSCIWITVGFILMSLALSIFFAKKNDTEVSFKHLKE